MYLSLHGRIKIKFTGLTLGVGGWEFCISYRKFLVNFWQCVTGFATSSLSQQYFWHKI